MKKPLTLFFLTSLALMFLRCSDEQNPVREKVRINFTIDAATPIPQDLILLVSVQSNSGDLLMDYKPISFSASGSSFTTAPLDLTPGSYIIQDFILTDATGSEIIYAAPKAKATLATQVDYPLMKKFQFDNGGNAFVLKMFSAAAYLPQDFGYTTYRIAASRMINVVVNTGDKNTSADAFILNGFDTVQHYVLQAKINHLSFTGDAAANYNLVIVKDGYSRYSYPFTMESLQAAQRGRPIEAHLVPAFTVVVVTNSAGYFNMEVDGFPGDIVTDWGDGTTQAGILHYENVREHVFAQPGRYFVSITGDLEQINTVIFRGWGASATDRINLENLPSLSDLEFAYTPTPTVVDVSQNHKMNTLYFWSTDVELIKISSVKPPSNGVELEGSRYVTTACIDGIIDVYYNYALAGNSVASAFFSWSYTPDPEMYMIIQPVGPPSPATLDKMRILQNTYGADFIPDVDYEFGSGLPW
jgi:hypothetical protein